MATIKQLFSSSVFFLVIYFGVAVLLVGINLAFDILYGSYYLFLLIFPIPLAALVYKKRVYLVMLALVFISAEVVFIYTTPDHVESSTRTTIAVCLIMLLSCEMIFRIQKSRRESNERLRTESTIYREALVQANCIPYQRDYGHENYTFMGERIYDLTGYAKDEVSPQLWDKISSEAIMLGELQGVPVPDAVKLARSGKTKHWHTHAKLKTRSGKVRWAEDVSVEILGDDGVAIRSIGFLRDITQQKHLEMLVQTESKVLETIAGGISLSEILEIIALRIEDIFEESISSILFFDEATQKLRHGSAPRLPVEFVQAIETITITDEIGSCGAAIYRKKPVFSTDIEHDPLWKDYTNLALSNNLRSCWSFPVFSTSCQVLGTFAVYFHQPRIPTEYEIQHLTHWAYLTGMAFEAKQAQETIRQNELHFRALIENTYDMIIVLNEQGKITYCSPSVEKLTGYPFRTLLGQSFLDFIHSRDKLVIRSTFERLVSQETPSPPRLIECNISKRDGTWLTIEAVGKNLLDNPAVNGIVVNARDISDRKKAEKALQESEERLQQSRKIEAVGLLARGIAHDFNNLLTIINGNCELLLFNPALDEKITSRINEIKYAGDHASYLTRQLLAFSRQQALEATVLDLHTVLHDATALMKRILGNTISLSLGLCDSPVWIRANTAQLQQVILNLTMNAHDAMPGGGMFRLETTIQEIPEAQGSETSALRPGQYALVTASDSGVGIKKEMQHKIFDPFFSTKSDGKGSGLGLSITFSIIRQLKGSIEVFSEEGKGTSFQILIPLVDESEIPRT